MGQLDLDRLNYNVQQKNGSVCELSNIIINTYSAICFLKNKKQRKSINKKTRSIEYIFIFILLFV